MPDQTSGKDSTEARVGTVYLLGKYAPLEDAVTLHASGELVKQLAGQTIEILEVETSEDIVLGESRKAPDIALDYAASNSSFIKLTIKSRRKVTDADDSKN